MGLKSADGIPEWKRELPPLPRWDLARTKARAVDIYEGAMRPWRNCTLTPDTREGILEMLQEHLRLSYPAALATMETLVPYGTRELTDDLQRLLCMQFSANITGIKKGIPVQCFTGVREAMWIPVEIHGFESVQRGPHVLAKMHVNILDGLYAGFRAVRVLPYGFLHVLGNDLGFSRRRRYEDPQDLWGLHFAAWVEPSIREDIQFDKYWLTPAMEKRNCALIKKRKPTERELEEEETDTEA